MQRKVIGYARVNPGAESDLDHQIIHLQDAGVAEVLTDIQSGLSDDRAGLNCLITLIEAGQVDEVVVTRVDRLSRSLSQLWQLFNLCQGKQVAIKVLEQHLSFR